MINVDNGFRQVAEPGTIIRTIVGSNLHGLNLEGTDDSDEMGVTIEPPEFVIGLRGPFEQWVYRTQPEGMPSGPGDLDLTVYSLRKYVRLALSGNPTVLLLLFAPGSMCSVRKSEGKELQDLAPAFIAKTVAEPFHHYVKAQRERLMGQRGGRALRKPAAHEIAESGYDTKYAMHMVRLGFQGAELLETGRITLPMPAEERAFAMAVRRGEVSLADVVKKTEELEREMLDLADSSRLPDQPDRDRIEDWMLRTYLHDKRWL